MNIDEIKKRVQSIGEGRGDYERAHTSEDQLMQDFIAHVRDTGDDRLSAMAAEVLKTGEIDFARWCA